MIFELGVNRLVLVSPAQYPVTKNSILVQASDKSASGVTHVESFGVETGESTYVFKDMSNIDYIGIMEWFVNVANGKLNKFDLTDDLGALSEVRFTTSRLVFKLNDYQLWNGSFTVETEK